MKQTVSNGKAVILLLMFFLFCGGLYVSLAAETGTGVTVVITMRNGEEKPIEPGTFKMEWEFPVTIMEEETCTRKVIQEEEIKDIHFINPSWNSCESKEAWLFEVDLVNGDYVQGFLLSKAGVGSEADSKKAGHGLSVRGISSRSGQEEAIPYDQVRKISFLREK